MQTKCKKQVEAMKAEFDKKEQDFKQRTLTIKHDLSKAHSLELQSLRNEIAEKTGLLKKKVLHAIIIISITVTINT